MDTGILKKATTEIKNVLKEKYNQKDAVNIFIGEIARYYLKIHNRTCKELEKILPSFFSNNNNTKIQKVLDKISIQNFETPEVIGWFYQYYISEQKEKIFVDLQKNIKAKKEDIPVATQLFTPEWIVKYMVNNSLGKFLKKKDELEFILENNVTENIDVEEITFIDPCCRKWKYFNICL